jgi:hypothetical protein
VLIYHDSVRRLVINYLDFSTGKPIFTLEPNSPAYLNRWENLSLSFEDAKALQRELSELLGRYLGREGGQRYVVRLAMAQVVS